MDRRRVMAITIGWLVVLLAGCESDNEHFCARYDYVFGQLLEDEDLPGYAEMRARLFQDMKNPNKKKQQAQFMLFVLEDWNNEIKPDGEDPREFCMRTQRWNIYPYGQIE